MKAIVPNKDVDAGYLSYHLDASQASFVPMIDEAGHGTKRFPTHRWKSLPIALPPLEEQRRIVRHIEVLTASLSGTIVQFEQEIALIQEFRDRLIADVVTGKLDVRAAATALPEVTNLEAVEEPDEDDDLEEAAETEGEELAA
ncbi:MAG: hypothetical protein U1E23_11630 [Reyranellaceae bacterium]